jgi:dipeptidyl aminopeptidase/acylaminoacyl peptidase
VVDVSTGRLIPVAGTGEEGYYYHAGWRPDSSEAMLMFLSRDGKRLDLKAVDPATGASRLVMREENSKTFVGDLNFMYQGQQRQFTTLPDNKGFLWLSERDGWRNLYLYDYGGKLQRRLTNGKFVVHEVLRATPTEAFILASIDEEAPYDRHVFRAGLNGGQVKRLTKDSGYHQPTFSPTGTYFADSHSAPARPRVSEVLSAAGRSSFRYAEADVSELLKLGYKPPEHFKALADDGVTPIYGVIIKPYDFDPAKRYPVVNLIYNGPFTANVPGGYAGSGSAPMANEQLGNGIAQMGFIAVIVDPRGSPGRSKAFHDVGYGRLGQIEIPDIVTAIRQAAATRPYMDIDRVGINGHSYGGYYALRGMVTAPNFFKAGYAGASGSLMQESENHEANMGLISVNPRGYEIGSNEALAGNLKGALKMMHGTSDPLASLASTMHMAEALIKAGKHFELLIMPNQGHNPPGPFNTYYFDDRLMFFVDHLGGPQ